jgi:hypothetical protein
MSRSYRFEYSTVNQREPSRALLRKDKQKYAELPTSGAGSKIQYGHAHAQTQELYQAREMTAELEALAGIPEEETLEKEEALRSAAAAGPGGPLGALPETAERPPTTTWQDAYELSRHNVRAFLGALDDVRAASLRLARTPVDLAKLALRTFSGR